MLNPASSICRISNFDPAVWTSVPSLAGINSSEWEKVFANPMATAAATDRIVHHSVILEFDLPSYRTNAAKDRRSEEEPDRPE